MAKRSEIESLIYLLEDPDPAVHTAVLNRFNQLGESCIPLLDEYQSHSRDQHVKVQVNGIIHNLTFAGLEQEFINFLEGGIRSMRDVENGIFLLARFSSPTLRVDLYRRKLDQMARTAFEDIRYAIDAYEKMNLLLYYVFYSEGFSGSEKDYTDPYNSFIHRVMDRKKGLPLSLAVIVLFLAERLDLPFSGVNMPMHFILKFEGDTDAVFLDPFQKGREITLSQCRYFLKMNGLEVLDDHFSEASGIDILSRYIRNLINGYRKSGDEIRMRRLKRLLDLLELSSGSGAVFEV